MFFQCAFGMLGIKELVGFVDDDEDDEDGFFCVGLSGWSFFWGTDRERDRIVCGGMWSCLWFFCGGVGGLD
jgi:hypothetical protein